MTGPAPSASATVHRVVQAEGRRFSLKLEAAYWTILEEEAAREGVSVGRLVHRVARRAASDRSLTADLRLHCVELLRRRAVSAARPERAAAQAQPADAALRRFGRFFASCPAAGLLLNPQQKVLYVNPAFEAWSQLRGESLLGKPVDWHFQIRLPRPVAQVLAEFAKGEPHAVNARVSYMVPGRIVVANAWASLALWNGPEDFVWAVVIAGADAPRPRAGKAVAGPAGAPPAAPSAGGKPG